MGGSDSVGDGGVENLMPCLNSLRSIRGSDGAMVRAVLASFRGSDDGNVRFRENRPGFAFLFVCWLVCFLSSLPQWWWKIVSPLSRGLLGHTVRVGSARRVG